MKPGVAVGIGVDNGGMSFNIRRYPDLGWYAVSPPFFPKRLEDLSAVWYFHQFPIVIKICPDNNPSMKSQNVFNSAIYVLYLTNSIASSSQSFIKVGL